MLALSALYAFAAHLGWFAALFLGIKAAVLAIVVQALLRIAGRTLDTHFKQALAVAAFFALFLFNLPFPLIVLGSGLLGLMVSAWHPQWLVKAHQVETDNVGDRPNWRSTALTVSVWLLAMMLAKPSKDRPVPLPSGMPQAAVSMGCTL